MSEQSTDDQWYEPRLYCDNCDVDLEADTVVHFSGAFNGKWSGHLHLCSTCAVGMPLIDISDGQVRRAGSYGAAPKPPRSHVAYSIDNWDFSFVDRADAIDALRVKLGDKFAAGAVFYEGDARDVSPSRYVRIEDILESLDERADDDIGEAYGNDFRAVSASAKAELETLLNDWVARHVDMRYWTVAADDVRTTRVEADEAGTAE